MKIYLAWCDQGIIGGFSTEGKARAALKQYMIDTGYCDEDDFDDKLIDDIFFGIIDHKIDQMWI